MKLRRDTSDFGYRFFCRAGAAIVRVSRRLDKPERVCETVYGQSFVTCVNSSTETQTDRKSNLVAIKKLSYASHGPFRHHTRRNKDSGRETDQRWTKDFSRSISPFSRAPLLCSPARHKARGINARRERGRGNPSIYYIIYAGRFASDPSWVCRSTLAKSAQVRSGSLSLNLLLSASSSPDFSLSLSLSSFLRSLLFAPRPPMHYSGYITRSRP